MATRGLVLLAKDTFSGVSSVVFDNVFSNTYKQYKIISNVASSNSSPPSLLMRMRVGGSTNSSTQYQYQTLYANGSSVTATRVTSTTYLIVAECSGTTFASNNASICDILNPFQSTYTSCVTASGFSSNSTTPWLTTYACGMSVTTSYDGCEFIPALGNLTGSITIYGLAQ